MPPAAQNAFILKYAQALLQGWELQAIKGRRHLPRVRLDRKNPLMKLIPSFKIVDDRVPLGRELDGNFKASYHFHHYTSTAVFDLYREALLAAGIDLDTGEVISQSAFKCAATVFRLTEKPLAPDVVPECARRVRAAQVRRATLAEKKFRGC